MSNTPDMSATSAMLAAQVQNLAQALLGSTPSSRGRTEWRWRGKGSLAICVAGKDRGQWFDHEAGIGGDALDFVAFARGCDRKAAWQWGLDWLGRAPAEQPSVAPAPQHALPAMQSTDSARIIWREAARPAGTPVEAYLRSRGLSLHPGAPLRYHPACPRHGYRLPAMVALMTDPVTAEPVGIHRTFLKPDGSGKADVSPAKMMLGAAGVIRLTPDMDVTAGLGIAEGIETALAVMQRAGWRPVWATGSTGAIARFPVLGGIEAITIFADADDKGAGMKAAHECAKCWHDAGREAVVMRPPHGADWFDALKVAA